MVICQYFSRPSVTIISRPLDQPNSNTSHQWTVFNYINFFLILVFHKMIYCKGACQSQKFFETYGSALTCIDGLGGCCRLTPIVFEICQGSLTTSSYQVYSSANVIAIWRLTNDVLVHYVQDIRFLDRNI